MAHTAHLELTLRGLLFLEVVFNYFELWVNVVSLFCVFDSYVFVEEIFL